MHECLYIQIRIIRSQRLGDFCFLSGCAFHYNEIRHTVFMLCRYRLGTLEVHDGLEPIPTQYVATRTLRSGFASIKTCVSRLVMAQ